jgi:hypothetical protein
MAAPLHGLFEKRVRGDDALLELSRLRYEQAGLPAEMYAGSPDALAHGLRFAPEGLRAPMVHLSRQWDLLHAADRATLVGMVRRFGDRVSGFVLHDRHDTPGRLDEVPRAAEEISRALVASGSARVFVEYAAGVTLDEFVALGERLAPFEQVGLCIDIGHVGVRQSRWRFAELEPQLRVDLLDLRRDDPRVPDVVESVVEAVASGLGAVTSLVEAVAMQPNPIHFHLHDGHPFMPGLADHFAFQWSLPVPFSWRGGRSLPTLFGVEGLALILRTARERIPEDRLSMTLEIHQGHGRLSLDPEAAALFGHWQDLTNAEQQNGWAALITQSAALVRALNAL